MRDLLGNSGEPRGKITDYSTELLENSPLSLSPLEAARVGGGGGGGGEPGPFEVMCLLVPTATRTPRRDVFSRSDCNSHPSERVSLRFDFR